MSKKRKKPESRLTELPKAPDIGRHFTQADLLEFDFTGWDWRLLPKGVVKAARNGAVAGHTVMARTECVNCKRAMWAVDPVREDLCEECDYFLRIENIKMRTERNKRQPTSANPFGDNPGRDILFNPFKEKEPF